MFAVVSVSNSHEANWPNLVADRLALQAKIGYTVDIITFDNNAGRETAKILWVKPTTVRQIKRLVRGAKELGLGIRVVGAGHSMSPMFPDPYIQIGVSLDDLRGEKYHLNQERNKLTVLSTERLGDVLKWAAEKGVTLGAVPFAPILTIPGITATSSHGSSIKFGPFANMVYGYELVDGSANVRKFNEDDNKEIIDACRVHLGLCGIIYKTILKVIPDIKLKFSVANIPVRKLLNNENRKDLVLNNWGVSFMLPSQLKSATQDEIVNMISESPQRIPADSYDIFKEDMSVWIWSDIDQNTVSRKKYNDTLELADGSTYDAVSVIKPFSETSNAGYVHTKEQCIQPRSTTSFSTPESDDFMESGKTMANSLHVVEEIFKNTRFHTGVTYGTLGFRWMRLIDDCLLCTTKVANKSSEYKLVMYTEIFVDNDKCEEPILNDDTLEKLLSLESRFGVAVMKNNSRALSHWGKRDKHIPGSSDRTRRQFGDDLLTFINMRNKYKLDNKNLFVNTHLKDIFRDTFA
ncbi:unnamed protein product [Owenia fusiformis]|uniref:FAD-binding PCMH-type domain-containing protein n=1 Tax=Owenia fusiformis TaxID=6347 RepID=A0A8S4PZU9_OWEFU|nr:unnamed protein product [Owenia fusiformis]